RSHGWYDLPPFSYDRSAGELRTFVASGRRAIPLVLRADGASVEVSAPRLPPRALQRIATRILSLDLDAEAAAEALAGHPELALALAEGGGRMLRAPSLFEDAVKMLLTTNCSWAATRGMVEGVIALAGAEGRAFPGAEDLTRFRPATLRTKIRCGYRAEPLSRLARRVASGRLDLSRWERPDVSSAEIREEILTE